MTFLEFGREICRDYALASRREWLVTNGLGGYAAGTVAGALTRSYHGYLVAVLNPPVKRRLLFTKLDETVTYNGSSYPLYCNHWGQDSLEAQGLRYLESFHLEGTLPVWTYALEDIFAWHARGTRYRIKIDPQDGLLYAGEPGVQLTWMDAKVGDWVVTLRPNQIFAVSLSFSPLHPAQQRAVVDLCAQELLTSQGLRSLAPGEAAYSGNYGGDQGKRDAAYHQGTVWGWLIGPFLSAHLKVYRDPKLALRYLAPLRRQLRDHGLGTLSEVYDGDPPHTPRGCFAQAWSVAEVLRLWKEIQDTYRPEDG